MTARAEDKRCGSAVRRSGVAQVWVALLASACLLLTACIPGVKDLAKDLNSRDCPNTKSTLTALQITPPLPSIPVGFTQGFTATGIYSDSSTCNLTAQVEWTSVTPSAVTVTSSGVATGVAVGGPITISAQIGGIIGTARLTVTSAVLVTIQMGPPTPSVAAGLPPVALTATGVFSDSSTLPLTSTATWTSSNPTVASIAGPGSVQGNVVGTANIAATFSGITGSIGFTVTPAVLTAVQVTPNPASVAPGFTQQFVATGILSDSTTEVLTASATWSSGTLSAATIDSSGLATGVATGSSIITAQFGGFTDTVTLTVTAAVLDGITVTSSASSVAVGQTQQFMATGHFSDSSTLDITTTVAWSSSDLGIATITSPGGLATGVAAGSATLTAQQTGVSNTATLTVTADVLPTVAVSNLRNNGVTHSGFMIGTSVGGTFPVAAVEISIDGGGFATATGTASWKFQLPTGGSTWREGSIHTLDVRVRDTLGNVNPIATLGVRKGVNRDINGDGYEDMVVGAPTFSSDVGAAYVFYSRGSTGISTSDAASADAILTGDAGFAGSFGTAVALGDVNGDGFADVVVGASAVSSTDGAVYIFHSVGSAGVPSVNALSANTLLSGITSSAGEFGVALAVGDVNGDGFADVVVGADQINTRNGAVYVFQSSGATGVFSASASAATSTVSGDSLSHAQLGFSVAVGDLNGDGLADVVAGAPATGGTDGAVFAFHSQGVTGIRSGTMSVIADTALNASSSSGEEFGFWVAVGNVNGAGGLAGEYASIFVGAPLANFGDGAVFGFHSAGVTGVASNVDFAANTVINGVSSSHGNLGGSLAIGDADGDGFGDLIAGASAFNGGDGGAFWFRSSGSGGIPSGNAAGAQAFLSGRPLAGGFFGLSVAASDLDGDGRADMIIGADADFSSDGAAYIFISTTSGVGSNSASGASATLTGSGGSSENFGSAVQ